MKLRIYQEKNYKKLGIILFTMTCIFMIVGILFYRTFASYEVNQNLNVLHGNIEDVGDVYFAFYVDDVFQKEMPNLNDSYVLDEEKSYCGVFGTKENTISVKISEDGIIHVQGVHQSRTKCNLYFVKGAYILGKGIPIVTEGDGLYEVKHPSINNTINDTGFSQTEYRYAGYNPDNYVWFNDELWRIIGLVNVMTSDTTVEQRVKIVRESPLKKFYGWDKKPVGTGSATNSGNSTDWTDSELMEMLNGIYYQSSSGKCLVGENFTTSNQETCTFDGIQDDKGLNELARRMIDQNVIWNVAGLDQFGYVIEGWYSMERGNLHYGSRPIQWSKNNTKNSLGVASPTLYHGIALIYPSDYGYATIGGENSSREDCLAFSLWSWDNPDYADCVTNDYLKVVGGQQWTLISDSTNANLIFRINVPGDIGRGNTSFAHSVSPTLYLLNDVSIYSGTGSRDQYYKLLLKS